MNCADPDLIKFMEFMVKRCDPAKGKTYATAKKLGQELLDNCRGVVGLPPLYKDGELFYRGMHQISYKFIRHFSYCTSEITEKGEIIYSEGSQP